MQRTSLRLFLRPLSEGPQPRSYLWTQLHDQRLVVPTILSYPQPMPSWSYIAGFFDGEGSIVRNRTRFRLAVTQTSLPVLVDIQRVARCGFIVPLTKASGSLERQLGVLRGPTAGRQARLDMLAPLPHSQAVARAPRAGGTASGRRRTTGSSPPRRASSSRGQAPPRCRLDLPSDWTQARDRLGFCSSTRPRPQPAIETTP